jgi:hypothetical protein
MDNTSRGGGLMKTYKIAEEFGKFPGPRYESLGPYSGESFRDSELIPILDKGEPVLLDFDGTLGYGSSFLDEAFGGLVRKGYAIDLVKNLLVFKSDEEQDLIDEINEYLSDAKKEINE